jgi:hypothetical protein
LIYNALLVSPTSKKLCLARDFFLDTHGKGRLASCLANASLYDTGKWPCVDCHNDLAHFEKKMMVWMMSIMKTAKLKMMTTPVNAAIGYHHKGKRPNFASRFSRAASTARK